MMCVFPSYCIIIIISLFFLIYGVDRQYRNDDEMHFTVFFTTNR